MKVEVTDLGFKQRTKSLQERGGKVFQAGGNERGRGGTLKYAVCRCLEKGPKSELSEAEGHLLLSSGS